MYRGANEYSGATKFDTYENDLENILRDPSRDPICLPLDFLESITDGFSSDKIIGGGGFGVVYKGMLRSGKVIAVKTFHMHLLDDNRYQCELKYPMRIVHKNVVQLVGYCVESKLGRVQISQKHTMVEMRTQLLCFEYLGNGSLDKYIASDPMGFGWDRRYNIIEGICRGLYFLHEECSIVHLDLKPQNIMLDDNMVPKFTDFGLSRLLGEDKLTMTANITGSFGYMAPEYIVRGEISPKADIFSLGVIILEIVTGQRNYPQTNRRYGQYSSEKNNRENKETSLEEFIDNELGRWRKIFASSHIDGTLQEVYCQQLKQLMEIALKCVEPERKKRPQAWDILQIFINAGGIGLCDINDNDNEVTMNPTRGTGDSPVSSSLGAMGPLLRKVDLLLTPVYPLRRSVKHAIQLLKEDLEDVNDALVEQSMMDYPNPKAKYWMHEARELSYHIEDVIDTLMLPHTAANGKAQSVHGHKVARLKIRRLPNILKPLARIARIAELRTLLWEASERHQRYELDVCSRTPVAREVAGNLVGIDAPKNELTTWLTAGPEQLKVLSIVGPAGVGKTALAKELYRELGSQFECRAFVRVSRTPHMSKLLLGILSQIRRPKQNSDTCLVPNIIDEIRKHLQDKRYFIVIDGLWEARIWDIIKSAFPKGHNCSRIMVTCEVKDVATKFCSYHSIDVFELKPLAIQDSEKLFFDTISGSNVQCHDRLKEVLCRISRQCAGLPLATIAIAGLLASQPDDSDLWYHLLQYYIFSDVANLSLDELLKGTVNLCYNVLPQELKTCLLYLTMYPEGCTIRKVDLLKQWIAEGFITPTTEGRKGVSECSLGQQGAAPAVRSRSATEDQILVAASPVQKKTTEGRKGVAENYFAELVNRGMIQPEKIMHNGEVLSCTVHHIVFDLIMHKSRDENFTTAVDYSQTVTEFFMKVCRLSLHFSCAQYATKLQGIRLSQIRSLSFFGLLRCMPSIAQLRLLRVLILEFWDDNDECISLNLSRISGLVLLRYLKISSHLLVELPTKIQELKFLETLEIDARVWTIPDDIVHLPGLLHLSIQYEAKLPEGIGRITSLQTLQYFDLGNNSEGNVQSLCELINLRDLHITCSTALSAAHLKRKFVVLAASLPKLTKLRSLTMAPGAVRTTMFVDYSSAMLSIPMFLQRLELLPPICIFSRLPQWVGKLQKLRILKIVVRVFLSSDIDVLTGLPDLTVLSLYIRKPNTQPVVFSNGALPVLKYFKYTCGALFLAFQEEALSSLERLKLCFNVHKGKTYYHMSSGIEHLLNLKEMTVKIGAADGAEESDKKAAESAIGSAIRKHPRFPIYVNVRRIDWVEEE